MTALKIGTIDIETMPIEAFTWGLFKQNIGLNQIKTDWTIASFALKWLGNKDIVYHDCSERADPRDDSEVLARLWEVIDEADVLIGHNAAKFDMRKITARFIQGGFPPPKPVKVIDTLLEARKVAMFTSGRQEWLASILTKEPKSKHGKFPGFELWRECLNKNPAAWAEMKKYNIQDVKGCEKMYLALRPYITGHPNVATPNESDKMACPKCGSTKVEKRGYAYTQTGKYQHIHCNSCGGWSRTRYTENTLAKRRSILSN